jgi:hypothetical protein
LGNKIIIYLPFDKTKPDAPKTNGTAGDFFLVCKFKKIATGKYQCVSCFSEKTKQHSRKGKLLYFPDGRTV